MSYMDEAISFTFLQNKYFPLMGKLVLYTIILFCIFLVIAIIYDTFKNFLPTINGCLVVILFLGWFISAMGVLAMAMMIPIYTVAVWLKMLLIYLIPNVPGALAGMLGVILSTTIFAGAIEIISRLKK